MNTRQNPSPYTIYLFEKSADHRTPAWRRHRSVGTLDEARREMKALYATGNYERVEIKEQRFSRRLQRDVTKTLVVLNDGNGRMRSVTQSFLKSLR